MHKPMACAEFSGNQRRYKFFRFVSDFLVHGKESRICMSYGIFKLKTEDDFDRRQIIRDLMSLKSKNVITELKARITLIA